MLFKLQYVLGHQVFLLINLTDACHRVRERGRERLQSPHNGMGPTPDSTSYACYTRYYTEWASAADKVSYRALPSTIRLVLQVLRNQVDFF